ncbi:MAG: class I SAM-dependent methyltransferase [Proteobacteria bacterium]|nr:class I SAM-dependent methyltransferase [Pseudomonadota bacterium]
MKLSDIPARPAMEPWAEGDKIPWHDPAFSARMLREHLSQHHDAASRRSATIDRHVAWIHRELLGGAATRVLDLGCGPGLYTSRFAALGHSCVGIDFSPASIEHAVAEAAERGLDCEYLHRDLREGDFGAGFGLALLCNGELNAFRPREAAGILAAAARALELGGLLVLEPHTFEAVQEMGARPAVWYAVSSGLFSDAPHLCLRENRWDAEQHACVERYLIVDAESGEVTRCGATLQAYADEELRELVRGHGFDEVSRHPSLEGIPSPGQEALFALVAKKRSTTEDA